MQGPRWRALVSSRSRQPLRTAAVVFLAFFGLSLIYLGREISLYGPAYARDYIELLSYPTFPLLLAFMAYLLLRLTALQQTSANLVEAILENSPVGVILTDASGRVVLANRSHLEIMGQSSADEIVGQNVLTLRTIRGTPFEDRLRRALQGEGFEVHDVPYTSLAGKATYLSGHILPLRQSGASVSGLLILTQDVTLQHNLAQANQQARLAVERTLDSIADVVYVIDEDGRIRSINRQLERVGLYSRDQLVDHPFQEFISPVDRAAVQQAWDRLLERGEPVYVEAQVRRGDGVLVAVGLALSKIEGTGEYVAVQRDVTTARRLGRQLAQQREAAERRAAEFQSLYEISQALSGMTNPDELARVVSERMLALVPADVFFIGRYEEGERMIHFVRWIEDGEVWPPFSGSLVEQDTPSRWIIEHREPFLSRDTLHDQGPGGHPFQVGERPARSWLGVPLIARDRIVGVMSLQSYAPDQFDESHLRLLVAVAGAVAIAFDNALLFEQMRARTEELAAANEIARALNSTLKLRDVLQVFFERVTTLFLAEAGSLLLLDPTSNELVFQVVQGGAGTSLLHKRIPANHSIAGWVVSTGQALAVPDAPTDPRWYHLVDQATQFQTRSMLVSPLKVQDRVIGVIELINRRDGRPFTASQATLLETFSTTAAVAVENARLHEDTERSLHELRQLDRLKTEFVQNVSHELRTPLTFIKGYVEMLLGGTLGPVLEQQTEALTIVRDKTDAVIRLVNDILTLQSDLSPQVFEWTSLGKLALRAVRGAGAAAEAAGVTLRAQVPMTLSPVLGDSDRLIQVWDNLLGNAIKFSPEGGTVVVRVYEEGDAVVGQVTDHGIGIPPDQLERVFDRFYQVDGSMTRRFGGTGLGLAIVQRIVKAHGGQVWVESQLEQGSTFSFMIPKGDQTGFSNAPML